MAKKLHTRQKRMMGIATHLKGKRKDLIRKTRPKSFKSEEAAKTYAESKKLKEYTIKQTRHGIGKKFQLIL